MTRSRPWSARHCWQTNSQKTVLNAIQKPLPGWGDVQQNRPAIIVRNVAGDKIALLQAALQCRHMRLLDAQFFGDHALPHTGMLTDQPKHQKLVGFQVSQESGPWRAFGFFEFYQCFFPETRAGALRFRGLGGERRHKEFNKQPVLGTHVVDARQGVDDRVIGQFGTLSGL
ncbi:MAG: hypothetical protein ACI92Z_001529 [Paracoccaceae bacterium]|jgi:hypothetical protein